MENEPVPDDKIEIEIEIGEVATKFLLSEAPREFWWVKTGMGNEEIPRFGWEALGKDF